MFYSKKCKQCGATFFSFSEESLQNQIENHFMYKGHTDVIPNRNINMERF